MTPLRSLAPWLFALACAPAMAEETASFSDTGLTLSQGGGFLLDPAKQTTLTLEQARAGRWGDLYWFVDSTHYRHDNAHGHRSEWYLEFSPRASLGKLSGHAMQWGPVRDLLVAGTYERGRDHRQVNAALLGIGTDLDVPGFSFLQANLYRRRELHNGGWDAWQVTVSGARAFRIGEQRFLVDGFMDYIGGGGPQHPNLHLVPNFKWDLGHAMGYGQDKLWLGVRADLWRNKFGIANSRALTTDQHAYTVLLRWNP